VPAQVEAYFSPRGGVAGRLIGEIGLARKSVHLAIFSFTAAQLAHALVEARRRGADVKVIMDAHQRSKEQVAILHRLKDSGIEAYRCANKALMHSKYAILDDEVVATCSYNWTRSAEQRNNENLVIIRSPDIARLYEENFQAVFNWHLQFYGVRS